MVINTLEQRSKDNELKLKHIEYTNNIYSERPKHIHQNNYFNPTLKNDLLLVFILTTARVGGPVQVHAHST